MSSESPLRTNRLSARPTPEKQKAPAEQGFLNRGGWLSNKPEAANLLDSQSLGCSAGVTERNEAVTRG
jgi:hypothetical protein